MTTTDTTAARNGRLAELFSKLQDVEETIARHDADLHGDQHLEAVSLKSRLEQEIFSVQLRTPEDALAAVQMIRRAYLEDRQGELLGWGDLGILNLLDGLGEYSRQNGR